VPPGCLFHWGALTDRGLRVTDVRETKKQFQHYAQENIGPYSQQVGIPGPPRITFYEVHNYQGEALAAGELAQASDVMMAHPLALQLRNLQTLVDIGRQELDGHLAGAVDEHHPGARGVSQDRDAGVRGPPGAARADDGVGHRSTPSVMTMTITQSSSEDRMPNTPTTASGEAVVHQGTFAEGESRPETYPDEEQVGAFPEGESDAAAHPEEEHVGTFA
jgi:hypothetical protein